jgi:hypothetical protein
MIPVMVRVLKISTDSNAVLTNLNKWFAPNFHRTFAIPTFSLLNIYLFLSCFFTPTIAIRISSNSGTFKNLAINNWNKKNNHVQ